MILNEDTLHFIRAHRSDDVRALALQARRDPSVDMPAAITQIAGWQVAKEKVPTWAQTEGILYPVHLSLEQCSSELTARYKAEIIKSFLNAKQLNLVEKGVGNEPLNSLEENLPSATTFTDLTGGFGIDCAFLSSCFREATYVERQQALCEIASHNFPLLNLNHISVCHEDSILHLQKMQPTDWIFIDPARRDGQGGKTVAISDCEPNVADLEELLLQKASYILIKLSPMLDLTLALHDLKHVQAAYILSVGNECKELLLLLGRTETLPPEEIPIHCINLTHAPSPQQLTFTRKQEKDSTCQFATTLQSYLYEPNASLLKAGAFRSIAHLYKVEKLHPNSHLYTSDRLIPDFPGRKFQITNHCSFHKKEIKDLLTTEKKANLTVRNFPASVAELRKRLKLAEGGNTYLFATTMGDEKKVLIRCQTLS